MTIEYNVVQGIDDINHNATLAMLATLDALVAEKYITTEQATVFADTHVVAFVNNGGMWRRIRKLLSIPHDKCQYVALKLEK